MRTLPLDTPTMELLDELNHTISHLEAHPLTRAFAPDFVAQLGEWRKLLALEIDLDTAVARTVALFTFTDVLLDALFTPIVNAVLTAVNNNRDAPLYRHFLGDERPSDVKKPVLGTQLERMRPWVPSLGGSPLPALQAFAAPLEALVQQGDAATDARQKAEAARQKFFDIGEHKAFIDRVNALRALTFGKIRELMHNHAEMNLPRDFAELFFVREERQREATIASETRTIERLEAQLERHRQILAELQARDVEAVRARRAAAARAELVALEQQQAETAARMAALRAEVDQTDGGGPPADNARAAAGGDVPKDK